jgi:para-nitrobenzyl esterase
VFDMTWEQVIAKLPSQLNARVDIDPETVVAAYRKIYPSYSPSDVYFAASTAGRSWKAAIIQAEERAKAGAPAYVYQVDWKSPKDGGIWGAPHTIDIGWCSARWTPRVRSSARVQTAWRCPTR